MSNIIEAPRRQIVSDDLWLSWEHLIEKARAGDITELLVVAHNSTEAVYIYNGDYTDMWRTLGALEYAKSEFLRVWIRAFQNERAFLYTPDPRT